MPANNPLLAAATAVLLVFTACDSTGPERPRLDVEVTIEATDPWLQYQDSTPMIECTMSFTARASGSSGAVASWGAGERRWYVGAEQSTPAQVDVLSSADVRTFWNAGQLEAGATVSTTWRFWAPTVFALEHDFEYTVGGQTRTVSVRQPCGVDAELPGPPTLSDVVIEFPDTLEPSATIRVTGRASSAGLLRQLRINVRGAYEENFSSTVELLRDFTFARELRIPSTATLGRPVLVSVFVVDAVGQTSSVVSRESAPLVDVSPPVIELVINAEQSSSEPRWGPVGQWAATDTMLLRAAAYDNVGIVSLTAHVNGTDHEIPFAGMNFGDVVRLPVRPEWLGTPALSFTAIDAQGLRSAPFEAEPGAVRVFPATAYPTTSWELQNAIADLAWDDARNRFYVASRASEIIVLATPDLTTQRRIPLPGEPHAIDFSAGGDTLLVTLPGRGSIALYDLHSDTLVELPLPGTQPVEARRGLLLGDGTALLELVDAQDNSRAVVLDLTTLEVVAEVPGWITGLARNADRSIAAARTVDVCLYVYRAATRDYEPCIVLPGHPGTLSIDAAGQHATSSDVVIDLAAGAWTTPVWGVRLQQSSVSAPAGDGESFFLGHTRGVLRLRTDDGEALEKFEGLPVLNRIVVSEDGAGLLLQGTDTGVDPDDTNAPRYVRHVRLR